MIPGFVLLELLISTLIAGLISTGLLTTIFQINRVQQTVTTISSVYARMAILQNQMERDVMGAFVPAQVDVIQTSTLKQDQPKPLEKIFYGTSIAEGGRLNILTFITSNPLEIFLGVKDVKLKPRIARVVYRLVPDEKRKNSYILMRQEGTTNLSFEAYTTGASGELRSFPMIDGIQNLTIHYISIEQEQAAADKPSVKRTYKKSSQWRSEQKRTEQKKEEKKGQPQKKEPVRLPNQLELIVSLWDSAFEDVRTFHVMIPIAYKTTEFELPPKKDKDVGKEKKKKEEKGRAANKSNIALEPTKTGT